MTRHFKALVPFSSEHGIYNPGDEQPGSAPKELVEAWIEAGYAVEVEGVEDMTPATNSFDKMMVVDPQDEQEVVEVVKVPEDVKTPEIEPVKAELTAFDSMSYPQLKQAGKQAGIPKYNSMKQSDLIKALKGE